MLDILDNAMEYLTLCIREFSMERKIHMTDFKNIQSILEMAEVILPKLKDYKQEKIDAYPLVDMHYYEKNDDLLNAKVINNYEDSDTAKYTHWQYLRISNISSNPMLMCRIRIYPEKCYRPYTDVKDQLMLPTVILPEEYYFKRINGSSNNSDSSIYIKLFDETTKNDLEVIEENKREIFKRAQRNPMDKTLHTVYQLDTEMVANLSKEKAADRLLEQYEKRVSKTKDRLLYHRYRVGGVSIQFVTKKSEVLEFRYAIKNDGNFDFYRKIKRGYYYKWADCKIFC